MLTEETAKLLIEAMNRLSGSIERMTGMGSLGGGLHIYHHNSPSYPSAQQWPNQPPWPMTWGSQGNINGQ